MTVQHHVYYPIAIGRGADVDVKPLISDLVVIVLAHESHFVSFDPDISFAPAAIADVEGAGAVREDLDRVLPGVPTSAEDIVLRREFLLEATVADENESE